MRSYRAPNKRIIMRGGNGRFRSTSPADVGMGVCGICGNPFIPDLSDLKDQPCVDPREIRDRMATCDKCRKA
jgi:hypothetical protein